MAACRTTSPTTPWNAGFSAAPALRPASGGGSSRTGRHLARELKRPGVTMMILWEEYREIHPEGYGYSDGSAICCAGSNGG